MKYSICCLLFLVIFGGCKEAILIDEEIDANNGILNLTLNNPPDEIVSILATLTRPNFQPRSVSLTIDSSGQSASENITGLPAGIWHIKVDAYDNNRVIRYSGETDIEVLPGETTVAELVLHPTTGTLSIKVFWGTSLQTSLVLYLPFDNDINDRSIYKNKSTATNQNFTLGAKRSTNFAYLFNGIDNYITVANSPSINPKKQITITFWLRVDSIQSNYMDVFAKAGPAYGYFNNRQYHLECKQNLSLWYPQFKSAGDNQGQHELDSHNQSFNTNEWNYFTFIVDRINHKMRYYANGILVKEIFDSYSTFNINSYPLLIGSSLENFYEHKPLKGAIDEFRIYNRVLSEEEIIQLYNK